jgi:hypothetical protein
LKIYDEKEGLKIYDEKEGLSLCFDSIKLVEVWVGNLRRCRTRYLAATIAIDSLMRLHRVMDHFQLLAHFEDILSLMPLPSWFLFELVPLLSSAHLILAYLHA